MADLDRSGRARARRWVGSRNDQYVHALLGIAKDDPVSSTRLSQAELTEAWSQVVADLAAAPPTFEAFRCSYMNYTSIDDWEEDAARARRRQRAPPDSSQGGASAQSSQRLRSAEQWRSACPSQPSPKIESGRRLMPFLGGPDFAALYGADPRIVDSRNGCEFEHPAGPTEGATAAPVS
jgi:hypothetical protein